MDFSLFHTSDFQYQIYIQYVTQQTLSHAKIYQKNFLKQKYAQNHLYCVHLSSLSDKAKGETL